MSYIESGKQEGATVHTGGTRFGNEGYFISPTVFTDTKPHMKIVEEEIFGPVGVVIKFKDEAGKFCKATWRFQFLQHTAHLLSIDVIEQANDSAYGLASAIFSQDINRALETVHKIKAGTAWVKVIRAIYMTRY